MHTLTIIIPGDYYDSFLYENRLFLWEMDGSILVFDWENIIDEVMAGYRGKYSIVFECAFVDSRYFLGKRMKRLFADEDVRRVVKSKFDDINGNEIEINDRILSKALVTREKNVFPFPHSDVTLYAEKIYVTGTEGLYTAECKFKRKKEVIVEEEKLWDCPLFTVDAKYNALALSAGDEGLFEYNLSSYDSWWDRESDGDFKQPRKGSSYSSKWVYYSIYSTDFNGDSALVEFVKTPETSPLGRRLDLRKLKGIMEADEIFKRKAFSWGDHDKICQYFDNKLEIAEYTPWAVKSVTELLGTVNIKRRLYRNHIISAGSAVFGFILEYDKGIILVLNNREELDLKTEITNWRVFNRSEMYENQLHIIKNDRIEIVSLNNTADFQGPVDKQIGIKRYYGRGGFRNPKV